MVQPGLSDRHVPAWSGFGALAGSVATRRGQQDILGCSAVTTDCFEGVFGTTLFSLFD